MPLANSGWRIALVLVEISFWVALMLLLHPLLAMSQIGGFTPHFSVFASFKIGRWSAEVSCPIVSQPLWPACWIDTPDGSSSSVSRADQHAWDVYRKEVDVVPPDVVLAIRGAVAGSCVDDVWNIWSRSAEACLFNAY